jgi:outer membrane autotransporter protein
LAVANGLETATGDPEFDADFAVVRGNWETIGTDAEVPVAINAMGGEQWAPFATQRLAIARRLYRAVDARMATLDWREWESFTGKQHFAGTGEAPPAARAVAASRALAVGAVASAQVGAPAFSFAPAPRESGLGGWIDAYGFLGSLDGNSNSSKVDYQIAGGNVAMDYRFLGQNLVGLAGGYARTRVDPKQRAGDADADTGQVGLYLGRVTPLYYVDVATRFAYSSIDTERKIDFSDLSRKATARFDAYSCGAHFAGGLNVVDFGGVVVQPTARFDYTHLYRESFTEKGADSLDLAVGTEKLDSIVAQLGARLFGQLEIGDGFWLMPELRARWMHEFGDTEREINAGLAGALTGGTWRVSSVSWPRDAAVLGVGWTITAPKYFQLYLDYDATLGSGVFENGMGLGLRFVW